MEVHLHNALAMGTVARVENCMGWSNEPDNTYIEHKSPMPLIDTPDIMKSRYYMINSFLSTNLAGLPFEPTTFLLLSLVRPHLRIFAFKTSSTPTSIPLS